MSYPKVAVIVINYRTPQMTLDCLTSIESEIRDFPGWHVIVADSASDDGSADLLNQEIKSRKWNGCMRLVRLDQNRGFSAGNNAGMAAAAKISEFDAFLLVNSDTMFRRGAFRALSEVLRREPAIGLVGPRLEWPDGQSQVSCFRDIRPFTELVAAAKTGSVSRLFPDAEVGIFEPSVNGKIDWISFACVLIRKEVFASVGYMDEGFFMYFEDVDFCRRARQAGWRIAYAPQASVVHHRGGRTPDRLAVEELQRRPGYYYRSRARYLAKYYGRTGPCRANVCWLLGRSVSLVREAIGNKRPHTAACEAADIWKGALCGFARDVPARPG